MTVEQALNNLELASRKAWMPYNDHAICGQSLLFLKEIIEELQKPKEETKTKKEK